MECPNSTPKLLIYTLDPGPCNIRELSQSKIIIDVFVVIHSMNNYTISLLRGDVIC